MKRGLLLLAAALIVIGLGAGAWALRSGDGHTLSGSVLVMDMNIRATGASCSGARPFLYLHPGAPVRVLDDQGQVVGETVLDETEAILADQRLAELDRAITACELRFELPRLPATERYTVEVAERHTVTKTFEELEDDNWTVEIVVPE